MFDPTKIKKKTIALPERYCEQPFAYHRRPTHEVMVGNVGIGGTNPIRVQSMTIADTMDTVATVKEVIELHDAGCEIVRITAPSVNEAENLRHIKAELQRQRVKVPLVADIHYTPNAALVAADYVEKVRINPGNYADKKKFEVREYSDSEYQAMINRMAERFIPLVRKCQANGVAMRIGVNHGSLSDRIMCYYGDTPEGMVQSALEFIRICEDQSYREIVVSMKSSNPQVMIQAYRLLAGRMYELNMTYPFHLGVTEAGDGEDGRIKSAVGIGSLLEDGIGDTIRVSLTEDSVHEVPVAFAMVDKFNRLQSQQSRKHQSEVALPVSLGNYRELVNPFEYERRRSSSVNTGGYPFGDKETVRVGISLAGSKATPFEVRALVEPKHNGSLNVVGNGKPVTDNYAEWLEAGETGWTAESVAQCLSRHHPNLPTATPWQNEHEKERGESQIVLLRMAEASVSAIEKAMQYSEANGAQLQAIFATDEIRKGITWEKLQALNSAMATRGKVQLSIGVELRTGQIGEVGEVRAFVTSLTNLQMPAPIVWRYCVPNPDGAGLGSRFDWRIDCSTMLGSLLCDGLGDALIIHGAVKIGDALRFSYNLLQATRLRLSKTEFISCPSCGRTLFNLQTTTERIKQKTGHLKGTKIAVMGCIVNGPGEMADADFGYVGTGHKVVSLYVGKECVERNIPEAQADERLIALIKRHGKWIEPEV